MAWASQRHETQSSPRFLEEEMATHSSILAWRIPWTEEPGGLQFMGSQSQTRLSAHAHSPAGGPSRCDWHELGAVLSVHAGGTQTGSGDPFPGDGPALPLSEADLLSGSRHPADYWHSLQADSEQRLRSMRRTEHNHHQALRISCAPGLLSPCLG